MNPIGRFPSPLPYQVGSSTSGASARSRGATDSISTFSLGETQPATGSITDLVTEQFRGVNASQMGADAMVHSLITGGDVNEAEVLTAVQKADLAFRMMLQIRNKLMEAYREIQQIQI